MEVPLPISRFTNPISVVVTVCVSVYTAVPVSDPWRMDRRRLSAWFFKGSPSFPRITAWYRKASGACARSHWLQKPAARINRRVNAFLMVVGYEL
jgi:hypothetical protein